MSDLPKILVTGGNGQLGKEIQELAQAYPQFEFVFLSKEDLPINNFELVRVFFDAVKPAYCINCAAYTAVDKAESEKDLAFQVNGEAVGVMAAICVLSTPSRRSIAIGGSCSTWLASTLRTLSRVLWWPKRNMWPASLSATC